jgi:hypothetical protein
MCCSNGVLQLQQHDKLQQRFEGVGHPGRLTPWHPNINSLTYTQTNV